MIGFVRVLAFVLVSGVLAAGCGGTTKPRQQVTTCGIPYRFEVAGKAVGSGSCAGLLPVNPPRVAVHVGDHFSLEIVHEQNGSLDYPVPRPSGSAVVLSRSHGSTAEYVARRPGASVLRAFHTHFCQATDPKLGTCAVLRVTVGS